MNSFKTFLLLLLITMLFVVCGYLIAGQQGMVYAFIFAVITNFFSYWFSDKLVLAAYKAQELPKSLNPKLYNIVETLSKNAGICTPKVYYVNIAIPNAFATGRNSSHSAIAITDGLFKTLTDDEIKGVLSHEISHIKNSDILISCISATFAGAIMMLARFAFWFGSSRDRDSNPIALILMIILAPIAATFVQMAISRSREYLADETGAKISKDPMSLANALRKLSEGNKKVRTEINPATAHMFIVSPFSSRDIQHLFSTHPPLEERIKRLESMAEKIKEDKYNIPKVIY